MKMEIGRRSFLKLSTAAAVATAASGNFKEVEAAQWKSQIGKIGTQPDPVDGKLIRSTCLMCHSGCGIQGKVVGGELVKLDGNPYHPNTYDYVAKGDVVVESDLDAGPRGKDVGTLCPKGQAGVYQLYSPFRLQHPLKRVGPRGAGKWKAISWKQAIKELSHGGKLFKNVKGEENRVVEGIKSVANNFDPIGPAESDYMDEAPPGGYGPKINQFMYAHGRNEQSPMTPRFIKGSVGSPNAFNHCSRCAGTFYNVTEDVLNIPSYEIGAYPDYEYASYVVTVGSNLTQADYPMQLRARYLQKFAKRQGPYAGEFKHVVVDPRFNNCAAKATHNGKGEWVPIKPATDGYFLLGMIRRIIETKGYKKEYLSLPSEQVAKKKGYRLWSDMTYLVGTKEPKAYLTGKQAGLGQSDYVVLVNGKPMMYQDAKGLADLDTSITVKGVEYKTVFKMLKERSQEKTMAECDKMCDLPAGTIARIADEFASARTPVIEMFRGPVQATNGWWNGQAVCIINILLDRVDRQGGYTPGHAKYKGKIKGKLRKPKGVATDRHKKVYQGKKKYSTRPWYPLARRTVTPEVFSSIRQGYPYKLKIYMNYYNDPAYTIPYNKECIDAMLDLKALQLTFSIDAYMSETTTLCDYVLPDTEYLERFGGFKTYPPVKTRVASIRMPMVGSLDPKTKNFKPIRPDNKMCEDMFAMLAKECGLPGWGKDAGGKGVDLNNAWQCWNEYYSHKDFKTGYDPKGSFVKIGGKFENPSPKHMYTDEYSSGVYVKFPGGRPVRNVFVFQQKVAANKNSMIDKYFDGLPMYRTIFDCKERPIDPKILKEYPYQIHTWKDVFHCHTRTMNNLPLSTIKPQNWCELNPATAEEIGVSTGDWIKAKSPDSKHIKFYNNSMGDGWYKFQIRVTSRIRPGLFSVCHSYQRWGSGGRKWTMNGKPQGYDERVGAGFSLNPLYMTDPVLKNVGMIDPVGGGTQSYGTPIKMEKL